MEFRDRLLPEDKRNLFKRPIGRDLKENELIKLDKGSKLVTVGDVVSLVARNHGIVPFLSIYDGKTERHDMTEFSSLVEEHGWEEVEVRNPPKMITSELIEAVKNAFEGKVHIIKVVGEEDLATVACMFLAPYGTNIVYGWPGRGMMLVTTDENVRKEAETLINMMEELE
ncbi:MAG TPA: DUF359 domain-containing protein [Candidatus Methanomethylophilaceae archaeon]|nr:DUF359 domain-containing protein [Candidatus Methanomethylophilaceae archaeon]